MNYRESAQVSGGMVGREFQRIVASACQNLPVSAGHYNDNFLTRVGGASAMVRIPRPRTIEFDPRMMHEASALRYANLAGVRAPKLLANHRDTIIESFVPGVTPTLQDINWEKWYLAMIGQASVCHTFCVPPDYPVKTVGDWTRWLFVYLQNLEADIRVVLGDSARLLELPDLASIWCIPGENSQDSARLLHGDLHQGNVIVSHDGDATLLDWELAVFGDPAFDAAASINRSAWQTHEQRDRGSQLWLAAIDSGEGTSQSRLTAYLQIETYKSALVDAVRYPIAVASQPWNKARIVAKYCAKRNRYADEWNVCHVSEEVVSDAFALMATPA